MLELRGSLLALSGQDKQAPMVVALVALDHMPALHGMSMPALHQKPCGHGSQPSLLSRPGVRPKVPASQGVGYDEPSEHHDATLHGLQVVEPGSFCQRPAGQRKHIDMLVFAAMEPGAHCAGSEEPVAQECPTGHTVH